MKFWDVASISFSNLRKRKLRSWLTILGIVIAVASIVTLISIAFGVNQQISSRLNQLGNDVIQITPGSTQATRMSGGGFGLGGFGGAGGPRAEGGFDFRFRPSQGVLSFDDAQQLKNVDGVQTVDARIEGRLRASYRGLNTSLSVTGVDPAAFKEMSNVKLKEGRLLTASDRFSAVIGYRVASSIFANQTLLNRQIKMGDSVFRIVGILNESSGSFIVSDNAVYIPLDVAKQVLNESDNANQIFVKVEPGQNADDVAALIDAKLLQLHGLTAGKEDFTITTASFFQSAISDITNTLTLFLGGIAGISLLVGAIGVANTMFMSVLERTKEIGILKALGLKDSEVTAMFLVEAAAIGIIGGAIGIVLSIVASYVLTNFGVPSAITLELLFGALFFSAVIGVASGALPARNASKLQPVEALRYE
jgi:putative ABC transport system permease protein